MVFAYHVIWGAYGFWLPNDPRGSWSTFVHSAALRRFGDATKTDVRRSVAGAAHNHAHRMAAKMVLAHPPVRLTGPQAVAVANGFKLAAAESGYVFHACAILPDHVHLVVARPERSIGRVVGHLKTRARQALIGENLWHGKKRPVWAEARLERVSEYA